MLTYLGASPDGLVSRRCCGEGLIEIKCLFSDSDQSPDKVKKGDFYLS